MAKSKYENLVEPKLVQIEAWARDGLSEKQIANNLGIAYSTFRDYKRHFPALSAVVSKGKEIVDLEVENALLKSALGFHERERQAIKLRDIYFDENGKKCQNEKVEIVEVEKYFPPNVVAQKFWLTNRQKDKWQHDPNKIELDREILELRKKELEEKLW